MISVGSFPKSGQSLLASISQLADETGLSLETLVRYEQLGLIEPIMIGVSRRYGEIARLRLEIILKGKKLGFTLSEIRRLLETRVPAK